MNSPYTGLLLVLAASVAVTLGITFSLQQDLKTTFIVQAKVEQVCPKPTDVVIEHRTMTAHCGDTKYIFADPLGVLADEYR